MADASIDLQATNIFDVAVPFKTQSSTQSEPVTNVANMDEDGNVSCEKNYADIVNYTQSCSYCGTTFGTHLNACAADLVGYVLNSIAYTSLTINMTAGEYCTVDLAGHQHAANTHTSLPGFATVGVGKLLTVAGFDSWDGFGIPSTASDEFFGITCTNASPSSATLTFTVNHMDTIAADGTHLVGVNTNGRAELSMEFAGLPDGTSLASIEGELQALAGDWAGCLVDGVDLNDSNSDFDTFSFTAHVNLDIALP